MNCMSESLDSAFDQLVADCGLQIATMPMNDKQLLTNGSVGEDFRTELLQVQDRIIRESGGFGDAAVARLDSVVEQMMWKGGLAIELDGLVAVNGTGMYLTVEDDGVQLATPEVLLPGHLLVGKLAGVAFNNYPFAPDLDQLPSDYRGVICPTEREGLMMTLGSAMLCSIEDDGLLEDWFGYALIPLPEQTFAVHSAEVVG